MKTRLLLLAFPILFVTLLFTGCQSATDEKQDETERLNEWLDVKYEERIQMSPLQLTMLGRKELYDQIDDMSEEADERQLEWMRQSVNELKENFKYEALDAEGKVSYDLWVYQYELAEAGKEYKRHNYVFDQMRSVHTRLPTFLLNFHKVENAKDMEDYISRIEGVGVAAEQLLERARMQVIEGIRPPKFAYEIVITQAESLLEGAPFTEGETNAPIWADVLSKLDALKEAGEIDEDEANKLKDNASKALQDHFKPAYEGIISFIQSDLENAEAAPVGVSRHPNGEAFYNYMLKVYTTTDLTADEIHNIGLAEVERIHGEMRLIMEEVGFEGSMEEFFKFTNTDQRFFYPNTDEGREGYLEDSRIFLDGINERLSDFFGILPKAGLVVRRVESFREQDGAPQHYMPGTPDGSRDGIYYAHLSDMSSMPKTTMEAIAYHEGNPGHHMQISIAQELESVPVFRTQERSTAYVEGWALYSEKLAKEMGGYQDPYSDFGRLTAEIWRAIRLVVDTGLHSKGWTEEDAVNYFMKNSPIAEGAIKAEVRRYMVMPGQATAYKIGMIKIEELRARAEEALGDDFDIRDFHDTILGSGSMPLNILEEHVNRWIEQERGED
jgi:uncharacterized protein (DUF885 family)